MDIAVSDLAESGKVVQLGYEPNRINLISSITGVTFEDAWNERVSGELDGVPVSFIGLSALLRNKEATGRPKDLIDAIEMRKQDKLRKTKNPS